MSFLNKFKKEFEGLNISEQLQNFQGGQGGHSSGAAAPSHQGNPSAYSQPPSYAGQPPASSSYNSQHPVNNEQQHQYYNSPPAGQYGYQSPPYEQHGYQSPPPNQYGYQSPPSGQPQYSQGSYSSPPPHTMSPPAIGSPDAGHQNMYPPPSHSPYSQPGATTSGPVALAPGAPRQAAPMPPRWVPFWSEQSQQWFYAETTGRAETVAPLAVSPMPPYPGSSGVRGDLALIPAQSHGSAPAQTRPGMPAEKKSSSHTLLAAGGGFIAGAAATALVYEAVDAHKKGKRHGISADDFSDFRAYPGLKMDMTCNVCDQDIFGPYAHCNKCDGGDYDICRDCLAQGSMCKKGGKHKLVKRYPQYTCDYCDLQIRGDFYHCGKCNHGNWDVCKNCLDSGMTCKADGGHKLAHLYIPMPRGEGKRDSDSSSSDSD